MKQLPTCDWRGALVTYGSGAPAAVAAFAGRPFYVDVVAGRGYVLNGSAVVPLGTVAVPPPPPPPPPPPGPVWPTSIRYAVFGSSVRAGSGPGEPGYVSTRGPVYKNAEAEGITLIPVGIKDEVTRQGTPGRHSADGGARLVDENGGITSVLNRINQSTIPNGTDHLVEIEGGLNEVGDDAPAIAARTRTVALAALAKWPSAWVAIQGPGACAWLSPPFYAVINTQKATLASENSRIIAVDLYQGVTYTNSAPSDWEPDGAHMTLQGAMRSGTAIWNQYRSKVFGL